MAGHSKWANIKHRKAAQDAKKGKIYTKILRELSIVARSNPNPADNPKLRAIIGKALSFNMTKDMIDRAIQRSVAKAEEGNFEETTYEGYAPAGIAVIVEVATDNKNRTVGEIRHIFTKYGGSLGVDGSVSYLFTKLGVLFFERDGLDTEKLMETALECDVKDLEETEDGIIIKTEPKDLFEVKTKLESSGFKTDNFSFEYEPTSTTAVEDVEEKEKILKMIDMLEDLDDVQNVHTNLAE